MAGNERKLVTKAIEKVRQNPISIFEGGYGKPLGYKSGHDLSGLLKIKLRAAGIRVVCKVIKTDTEMIIIVIGACADDEVYEPAGKQIKKREL